MIKITASNGNSIELEGVDQIPAVIPLVNVLLGNGNDIRTVTVAEQLLSAMTAPAIAPEIVGDEIDEDEDENIHALTRSGKRGPTRRRTLNPPTPAGRWPDLLYLTTEMEEVVHLLRQYPEGLTSEEIGIGLGIDKSIASGRVNRLRDCTPLVELIPDGKYRLNVIGSDLTLRFERAVNPSPKNKKLGWDRFMARPLRDGRHKKHRR